MESTDLKTFIFGGCSYTHAADSWAWNQYPRSKVFERLGDDYPPEITNWDTERGFIGQYNGQKFFDQRRMTMDDMSDQKLYFFSDYYTAAYNTELIIDPAEFWSKSKKLDNCKVHVQGHGATGPAGTIRKIMHQIHTTKEDIDAIVFQISGMSRSEVVIGPTTLETENEHECLFIDDLEYIKIWDCFGYTNTPEKYNRSEYHKKLKDLIELSERGYAMQSMVHNIEALMNLTLFCQQKGIKLGYFHGWDNFKRKLKNEFAHSIPGEWIGCDVPAYVDMLYGEYVEPYLIGPDIYTHFYEKTKRADLLVDGYTNKTTGEIVRGGHPSPYAHQRYWNDIVYPFLLRECYSNKE